MSPAESSPPIHLLLEWPKEHSRSGWGAIYGASVLINLLLLLVLMSLPPPPVNTAFRGEVVWDKTPLYIPPDLLTQKAPNRQKVAKQVNLADLLASERMRSRTSPPAPAPKPKPVEAPKPIPAPVVAQNAPQIASEAPQQPTTPSGSKLGVIAPAPPPPQPTKNPFQEVGSNAAPVEHPKLAPPKAGVEAAINGLAQDATSRQTVITDDNSSRQSPGGIGSLDNAPSQHAAIELKSDPQGADMKPYLIRILAIVRANWRTVTPESARLGTRRGCTVVEFAIDRNGSIPKMVVADSSGSDPLDRAAAAGLMMSNPLPPLPSDFRGMQMRLAFSFSYNLPKGSCGG
ncbi:MAG TPA: TonB family protein [Bryobacteraceae bacterium]|nr:TonB family protein [Bryobacteraceae bacterium]